MEYLSGLVIGLSVGHLLGRYMISKPMRESSKNLANATLSKALELKNSYYKYLKVDVSAEIIKEVDDMIISQIKPILDR